MLETATAMGSDGPAQSGGGRSKQAPELTQVIREAWGELGPVGANSQNPMSADACGSYAGVGGAEVSGGRRVPGEEVQRNQERHKSES